MVNYAFVLAALFAGCFALPAPEWDQSKFFKNVDTESRIVGGEPAPEGSHPHMVGLSTGTTIKSFVCGGSLISTRTVLTAAHCVSAVYNSSGLISSLRGRVGSNHWDRGGHSYSFARNVTHQNWTSRIIKNDIGLLITSTEVVLTAKVKILPLNFQHQGGGVAAKYAGWGRIETDGALPAQLLQLNVTILDSEKCVEEVKQAEINFNSTIVPVNPDIEICTFHSIGHGICNGDSGSALLHLDSGTQIGIVSWGFLCAIGIPDVFTRVSAYQDWVENHAVDYIH